MGEGYIFVGWAAGQFENERGEKQPYANMYVISPVSDYTSSDYVAQGYKAEKLKCASPDVWKDTGIGDCQRQFEIERKRRRNYVVFRRRGCTGIRCCLAQKWY